jgi:S1-C subfamily serine protease
VRLADTEAVRTILCFLVAVVTAGLLAATVEADRSLDEGWASIDSVVNVDVSLGRHGRVAGTGIVIDRSGLVVTNNHVIRGATSVRVTAIDGGKRYAATVLGYSVAADVAVLRLAGAAGLSTAPLAPARVLQWGQHVTAFGNAGGLGGRPASEPGRIIALHRAITASGDDGTHERLTDLIESSADLQPGESGGPLVDSRGRVIGMNTASAEGFEFNDLLGGEAYAIPIARVLAVASQVHAGRASRTVHVGPTAGIGAYTGRPSAYGFGYYGGTRGALVVAIAPGSPAARAGLSAGDVITTLGGRRIESPDSFVAVLLSRAPSETVHLAWVDEFGHAGSAKVRLGSGPPE